MESKQLSSYQAHFSYVTFKTRYSPARRSALGKTVPKVLISAAQFFPIWTDLKGSK